MADFKKNYLNKSEIETLYNSFTNDRDRLMHKILQWTGRRITEALNLKPQDIDHERKKINFIQLKKPGGAKVIIPVDCDAFYDQLMTYIKKEEIKPDEFVFFSPYKGREWHLTKRRVEQIYMKHGQENRIRVVPHFLRHSFAIQLLDYKINAQSKNSLDACFELMNILGHADINTTIKYLLFIEKESGLKEMWDTTFEKEEEKERAREEALPKI